MKFSDIAWTKDGKGFYYSRFDEPKQGTALLDTNYFQKLYYHRLGAGLSEDKLIYERTDNKELGFNPGVTDDGRYLIITVRQGTSPKNRLYYKDLTQPDSQDHPRANKQVLTTKLGIAHARGGDGSQQAH